MLNRPEARNAQNRGMPVELNDAFLRAEADDEIRVVILGGTGSMFSSGHDMGSQVSVEEMATHQSWKENGGTREGAERLMLQEWHHIFAHTRRRRNLRQLPIAQVNGAVFSADTSLLWAWHLIPVSEEPTFASVT